MCCRKTGEIDGTKSIEMMEKHGLSALSGVAIVDYEINDQLHYGQVSFYD
ncbi:MAG: hypothetical protein PHP65_01900 [Bacilli bacterium]|jgi:hypothetical protein|nr:hypothetical protein [Bacilli bacterium]